jgi:hypothetical protein
MHDTALTEIKALLTLALLKSGTSPKDIQTAIDLAATTRLMAGEESAASEHDDGNDADGNVTNIRNLRQGGKAAAALPERHRREPINALNGDVKALLSLLLLQNGASAREIRTTLRMAAAMGVQDSEQTTAPEVEQTEPEPSPEVAAPIPQKPHLVLRPEVLPADIRPSTPKQRLRNDYLAPIERSTRVA